MCSLVGFNLDYQQLTKWSSISLEDGQLALNQNKLVYGTFGACKTFFIGNN
jgi:hypothetical protein